MNDSEWLARRLLEARQTDADRNWDPDEFNAIVDRIRAREQQKAEDDA